MTQDNRQAVIEFILAFPVIFLFGWWIMLLFGIISIFPDISYWDAVSIYILSNLLFKARQVK
jgi:hypothetical protein